MLSDEVIKILDYLCDKIGITIDWTSNNVFPYIEQLCEKFINWEISTSIAWMVIMCVATVLSLIVVIIVNKFSDWEGFEWMIFTVVLAATIVVCGCQTFDIIECKTFPEKVIYEYIQYNLSNSK